MVKLVSILSNDHKRMEVALTHRHKRYAERYNYDVVGNALDRLITIVSYFEHIIEQYSLPPSC